MFKKTPEQFIQQLVDVEMIHLKTTMHMEQTKDFGVAEDGVFTTVVEYVAEGHWGWRMHIPLSDIFEYELKEDDKENPDKAIEIREAVDGFAQKCAQVLKQETGLPGDFYFGEHEADSAYCLFYQEKAE